MLKRKICDQALSCSDSIQLVGICLYLGNAAGQMPSTGYGMVTVDYVLHFVL